MVALGSTVGSFEKGCALPFEVDSVQPFVVAVGVVVVLVLMWVSAVAGSFVVLGVVVVVQRLLKVARWTAVVDGVGILVVLLVHQLWWHFCGGSAPGSGSASVVGTFLFLV